MKKVTYLLHPRLQPTHQHLVQILGNLYLDGEHLTLRKLGLGRKDDSIQFDVAVDPLDNFVTGVTFKGARANQQIFPARVTMYPADPDQYEARWVDQTEQLIISPILP